MKPQHLYAITHIEERKDQTLFAHHGRALWSGDER